MTFEWIAFVICSLLAVGGALGMATTMSMFRSGIFLMASFIGVAGLFILLQADLLALLQVMMYVGGMLVMILFMVLFSGDPGGAMMADMKMNPFEKFFTLGIKPAEMDHDHGHDHQDKPEGPHLETEEEKSGGMDMSMTTPIKQPAGWLGLVVTLALSALIWFRPAFPVTTATPGLDSPSRIGDLLMGKYMMAFEGAGLLILIGIFGAVYAARPTSYPDDESRQAYVTSEKAPPEISE